MIVNVDIALLLVGFSLLFMEILSTGLFIASLGMASVTAGLAGAAIISSDAMIDPYLARFLAFIGALLLSSFFLSRFYRETRSARKSVLVGKNGIVVESHDLKRNLGKVQVDGICWISRTPCRDLIEGEEIVVSDLRNTEVVVVRRPQEKQSSTNS